MTPAKDSPARRRRATRRIAAGGVTCLVLGFATWRATEPVLPTAAYVYPPIVRANVQPPANAVALMNEVVRRMALTRDDRLLIGREAYELAPPSARTRTLVKVHKRAAAAALAAARRRPGLQIVVTPRRPSGTPGMPALVGLTLLDARARIADPAAKDALKPLADALHIVRRYLYVEDDFHTALNGAAWTGLVCDILLAERARLLARPTPELTGLLTELNAMDRLERPLGRLLVAERDDQTRIWTDPKELRRLDGDSTAERIVAFEIRTFGPTIAADFKAFYDHAIEALDRRRFADVRALDDLIRTGWPLHVMVFHPGHAVAMQAASASFPTLASGSPYKILDAEARFEALRVAVAAELYRRRASRPPAALADLVPAYLPAAPADPYRPDRPLGFAGGRLWSVAWDGTDQQGGVVVQPQGRYMKLNRSATGDLVLLPPMTFPLRR